MKNIQLFDAYYLNSVGVWYFTPNDFNKYQAGLPTYGFGCIKYSEGSIYTGEIWFDGESYYKEGYGQQDFSHSTIGITDAFINEKKHKFAGQFDYKRNNWIYGNGVLYYVDQEGKPSHFIKGFFRALDKVRDFEGSFDYSTLIEGYTKEMEFDYDPHRLIFTTGLGYLNEVKRIDNLFLGDSYFEFWNYPQYVNKNVFNTKFDSKTNLNLGIGGSTFEDWIDYLKLLKTDTCPKNIFINLGFNDLHCGYPLKTVISNAFFMYKYLRKKFYKANIVFLTVTHSPAFTKVHSQEEEYNQTMIDESIKQGFKVLDLNQYITSSKDKCFYSDDVHLNENGYSFLLEMIKKEIEK